VAWLAAAGLAGLSLGLLVLAAGTGRPLGSGELVHSTVQPHGASNGTAGPHGEQQPGWFDLELPDGELHRVRPADALSTLLVLKEQLDQAPVDARLDLEQNTIIAERPGRRLDVDASLAAIDRAVAAGMARAPLAFSPVAARRRANELGGVAHDVVLGAFETRRDRSSRDREHDLMLLARALDGNALMPGEVFSFNAAVGPRDETHGYRLAAAAELGEDVDGVGGTASQCASTLFAAATLAGLDVRERHPHRGPRPLIELGLEAAVAYPSLDLRLANPYDFPLVLRAVASDGRLRAEIRGRRRPYTITLVRKVARMTPFVQLERADASLAFGERVLAQRGVPGLELHWHDIRHAGAHAVRRTSIEHHPPTPQIVLVGAALAPLPATGRPQRDNAPEYVPHELLVMTQTDAPDGSLAVQRFLGRSGGPACTKNVGDPACNPAPGTPADGQPALPKAKF